MQVSNLDHLFLCGRAIMMLETSTSSLSFRFSELSQPIWSLLPLVPQLRKEQFMKKTMSVLLMGFIGLVGTFRWIRVLPEEPFFCLAYGYPRFGVSSNIQQNHRRFSIRPLFAEFADRVGTHLDHFSTLRGMWRMCGCTLRTPD